MNGMKYITDLKDLPASAHYVVLMQETRYDYDHYDSRSGGGSSIPVQYVSYIAFDDEVALTAFLKKGAENHHDRKAIRVLHVKPMTVETQITVKLANAG